MLTEVIQLVSIVLIANIILITIALHSKNKQLQAVGVKCGNQLKYEVLRISSQKDSTSGLLFEVNNGKRTFLCYTLEDEQRDVKVWGETRIPAGTYKLGLRTEGGFHNPYL